MSKTIRREACQYCKSKNNICVYLYKGNELKKCMTPSCEFNLDKSIEKGKALLNLNENQDQYINKSLQLKNNIKKEMPWLLGEYKEYRGISKETCTLYDYQLEFKNNQINTIGNIYNNENKIIAQKIRLPNKDFPWRNYQENLPLFGQYCFCNSAITNNFNTLVITEGFEDAMSVYEATRIPAVSINCGAGNAKQDVINNLSFLLHFEKIILWFDNDEAGKTAIKECSQIPDLLGRLYIVKSTMYKDANELLQAENEIETIRVLIDRAEEVVPEGIQFGNQLELKDILIPELPGKKIQFTKLNEMVKGIKPGKVYLIGAGTGCGKSTFVKNLIFPFIKNEPEYRIANIFLEESQKYTIQSLIGIDLEAPVHQFEEDPIACLGLESITDSFNTVIKRPSLAFLDHFGSLHSIRLMQLLEYLAVNKKFNLIVLDHISIAISGLSTKEGERKDIDILMTKLKELTTRTGVSIILISHLSRPVGKGFEEGLPVTLNSFRGSGSLAQLSDIVIGLERNTMQQVNVDNLKIRVLKNRITGKVGLADELTFIENKGTFVQTGQFF